MEGKDVTPPAAHADKCSDANGLLTANQKLKRKAIESRYEHAIEQMYQ